MWLGPKGGLVEAVAELRVESQAGLELQAGEQGRGVEAGRLGLLTVSSQFSRILVITMFHGRVITMLHGPCHHNAPEFCHHNVP